MNRVCSRALRARTSSYLSGWPALRVLLVCCVWALTAPVASVALAKPPVAKRANTRAKPKPSRAKKAPRARGPKHAEQPAEARPALPEEPRGEARPSESRADTQRKAAQDAAAGADAQVVREGDTQVKVMSFSGLDIEGRLKSPQLLYFVGRVRAEFDRPTLPHRSFMPELDGTTHSAPLQ